MNRPLKFRVWDIVNKEFNFQGDRQFLIGLDGKLFDGNGCPYDEYHIVQQHTGLIDLKGNEIYEGDIIQLEGSPYKYEVVWNKWQWCIDSKGVVADFIQGFTSAVEDRAIVIGNIFQNSKLLNY